MGEEERNHFHKQAINRFSKEKRGRVGKQTHRSDVVLLHKKEVAS